nr:UPF0687 protein C20orf27 homolog isoform X3 [Anser cygnoides]
MAALGPAAGDGGLRALYRWVDAVPLSRPRRNIARDFSDGVLAAELVKFFFPAMVQLHSYVPASSTPQKLANWGHLNRKVLSKLNFSLPDEVIRQVVQCRPGTVEQVLLLLRQKIEEKQKQSKAVPGPEQELGARTAQEEVGYLETGYSEAKSTGQGCAQESPGAAGGSRSHLGYARHPAGDTAAIHLQLAEKEQALLLAQEAVQVSGTGTGTGLPVPPEPVLQRRHAARLPGPPFSGGTLGHVPAWRWPRCCPDVPRLPRVLLWQRRAPGCGAVPSHGGGH